MCEFLLRSYRFSSLVSQAWYVFVLFKPFSRFTALTDLHSRAWDDIQSSARQNKVVCLSESPESGRWKKGIAKVLPQQIYSGILTVEFGAWNISLLKGTERQMCDYYLSLCAETTPHHWTDMKLAIWTTKAWAKKHRIGESDNNTKNIGWHGSVSKSDDRGGAPLLLEQNGQTSATYCCYNFLGNR